MDSEAAPGGVLCVSRDIYIDGRLGFSRGERVAVEAVVPNAERPQYKYVVLSARLNQRFQLSDADVQAPAAPLPESGRRASSRALMVAGGLAILAIVATITAIALFGGGKGSSTSVTVSGRLVCLDPGHGGSDTGALENGVAEKDVNLDIALRARPLLEAKGYRVILTRESDTAVSLARRCAIANTSGASVLVSIHNNARPPDVQGTTTYYFRGSEKGRALAVDVQREVVARIQRPDRGVRASRLYVVRNAAMPAALLEGVFLTDRAEAALIKDAGFRQRMAEGLAAGIDGYLTGH